jgi:hypothetical protein
LYRFSEETVVEYIVYYWVLFLKMKRLKNESPNSRKFRLSHFLLGVGVLYLLFLSCNFTNFLKIVSTLSGDESENNRLDGNDKVDVGVSEDADLTKPFVSSVYKDAFHRKLEDNRDLDAPLRPKEEPKKEEDNGLESMTHIPRGYGRITGEIMLQMNRTSDLSVLEKMADEAWTLGLKAWKEIEMVDDKEFEESAVVEGGKAESCPSWISMSGEELLKGDGLMFLPCGLAAGSSITVVGTPHYAHKEYSPQLAKLKNGDGLVSVSQFLFELQGLKSVEGEDPPKILHLNPRLKGDWSKRPVIEHNTCYRMHWGTAQRCDGRPSEDDDGMLGMILSRFVFSFSSILFWWEKVLRNRVFIALNNVEWKENRKVERFNDIGNDRIRTKRKTTNEYENI